MIANLCRRQLLLHKPQIHFHNHRRCLSLASNQSVTNDWLLEPDPFLVDHRHAPPGFNVSSAVVYRDIISVEESKVLTDAMDLKLRRRRYERGHWDAVIIDYKEIEILDEEDFPGKDVLRRIRNHLQRRHLSNDDVRCN